MIERQMSMADPKQRDMYKKQMARIRQIYEAPFDVAGLMLTLLLGIDENGVS